jgi:hypothetical protein
MDETFAQELEDAILLVTDTPEWHTIQQGLFNEIQASQVNAFTLTTWDKFNEEKGFIRGLAYVITLRQQLLTAKQQAEDDANL